MLIVTFAFADRQPAERLPVWAGFGTMLRGFLADPVRLKWFNIAMGLLLRLATLWPMLQASCRVH